MDNESLNRRVKLFTLSESYLLLLFRYMTPKVGPDWPHSGPCMVPLPVLRGDLPDDAYVLGVYHDTLRSCLLVKVGHPDWPEIEPGAQIPVVNVDKVFWFERDDCYRFHHVEESPD